MATIHDLTRVGLTARQADHWTRRGWLKADNADCGSGHIRTWPAGEVRVAEIMARLVRAGVAPPAAETVARGGDLAPGVRVIVEPTGPGGSHQPATAGTVTVVQERSDTDE